MSFIVAIDGPAGSGKGTITKILSKKLKLNCIDTGAMYRCVALSIIRNNIELNDIEKIKGILDTIDIQIIEEKDKQIVKLNGEDVTKQIRENPVNKIVSPVAAIKEVRMKLVELQRKIAETQDVIMEGIDITTVVFPNADLKIYMDADLEERARRRYEQNQSKNIECTYEEVLEDMRKRDEDDKAKEFGALKVAEDAIIVDSTSLSQEEVVKKIEKLIKKAKVLKKKEPKIYAERPDSKRKRIVSFIVKGFFKGLYSIFYKVEIIGEENIEKAAKNGGYIICANHLNYLDAAAIVMFSKEKVRFIAK